MDILKKWFAEILLVILVVALGLYLYPQAKNSGVKSIDNGINKVEQTGNFDQFK
ncbi:hypothetical protein ABNF72_11065 [Paenibacillus larvae]|uniref:Uncharacterized protein n=1 Tax=Paenibacillus larvae subsp. larvae TaxID=147375 RepID=A0A6C0R1J4_9BACL|nr:hypothetical protein [Paenibacillus larvae]MCY7518853.1 hypothetical protein [Paenibacillus larvae]MCY9500577.1 hypothetical protein [Paenibacillus larvae]MCY9563795.1 hypothetical protein [Paenibacillus larvae]MCY9568203.1 hypothetical protein [Paenibacillus larvae]MCY9571276.1 hypothetical protein [Paenibacillus larvae]